jgi:HAD superfamily hydrolase (TIGR01509 family)
MARALQRHLGIIVEQYDRDYIIGRSWIAIYDSMRQRYPALTWTRAETIAHTAALRDEVIAELGVTVLPGAPQALAWTRDYKRGLVTGSSHQEAMQVLPFLGAPHFDVIIAAEDVARSKPAPDGYRAAMDALGLEPNECVVVEDSEAGITAGLAAGCHVLAVRAGNFGGWKQDHAHRVLATLDELTPSLVDALIRDKVSP